MEGKKTLVIVNAQNDRINGTVAIEGAEMAVYNIRRHLGREKYDTIIFITESYAYHHESFKENGGDIPRHCVINTVGAGIENNLYMIAHENCADVKMFYYGYEPSLLTYPKEREYVVCGLNGDEQVLQTLKDIKTMLPEFNSLSIFSNGIASSDGGEKLNEYLKENKDIKII